MSRTAAIVRWGGVGVILFAALAKAMTTAGRVPWWDIDPILSWTPETTRTPGASLVLDSLVWIAVALIVVGERCARRAIPWKTGLLLLAGCSAAVLHAVFLAPMTAIGSTGIQHGDFGNLLIASGWSAALAGGWALTIAARDRRVRAAAAAILLGAAAALAARGLYQVFVEHPRLVASFDADRSARLEAIGLDPSSQTAAIYERRLRQPEATGWFGFSNVYGSIIGAMFAAWAVTAVNACRAARRKRMTTGEAGLLVIVAAVAGVSLALSGSKGAIVATALGLLIAATVAALRRISGIGAERVSPPAGLCALLAARTLRLLPLLVMLATIALPLVAIAIRGSLGERLSELSIYFRSQYVGAAARIITEHPLAGVGPAWFKDAYMLAKPPTSPEEVESPHSLLFDWQATLGLLALGWSALFITWLARAARSASGSHAACAEITAEPLASKGAPALLLIPIAATAYATWTEFQAMGPDLILLLSLAGMVWWFVASIVVRRLGDTPERGSGSLDLALLAAAIVLAAHAMIEVTPIFQGSAAVFFAILGLAAAGAHAPIHAAPSRRAGVIPAAIVVAIAGGLALATAIQAASTLRAETHLNEASLVARDSLSDGAESRPDVARLSAARKELLLALPTYGFQLYEHLVAISWRIAISEPDPAGRDASVKQSLLYANEAAARYPRSSAAWGRLGAILEATATNFQRPELLADSARAWERAAALDPHGLTPARRAALNFAAARNPEAAARWAVAALEINSNLRLDPIKQLTEQQEQQLRALIP